MMGLAMNEKNIRVLVADDSRVSRMLLVHLLQSDPDIQVVGAVNDGQAALDFVRASKPDVVLMDIHMPVVDGFEATRRIMESEPLPIVICTATTDPKELATTFRLMEAGAVACVEKPVARGLGDFEALVSNLLQTVKLMSEVRVVRRWPRMRQSVSGDPPGSKPSAASYHLQLVGVGASTGGPLVLQSLLASLPKEFPLPVLIVQHISRGFLRGLVDWLNQTTGWQVHVASHGTQPLPGHAYLAPDDFHMAVANGGRIVLTREPPDNGLRPAISYLFRSIAEVCGPGAIGVLLTGMGKDGACELKLMRDRGATTIAQDRDTSVVHGMPGEAIALGGATHVLAADRIADTLVAIVNRKNGSSRLSEEPKATHG
jgi:two-component system chemotaxis response regulator CheB